MLFIVQLELNDAKINHALKVRLFLSVLLAIDKCLSHHFQIACDSKRTSKESVNMAFFNRTQVGLKDITRTVTIPGDPKAKLMYYLDCMCTVLELDDDDDINRLRDYNNYSTLTRTDTSVLLHLCILLKPDELMNKCIFQNDSLCGDLGNKFYDLETVRNSLLVAGSVLIGGQQKRVTKIMTFKMTWLRTYWSNPIQVLIERQRQEREVAIRQQQRSESCVIL
jgi:hypothetical protein